MSDGGHWLFCRRTRSGPKFGTSGSQAHRSTAEFDGQLRPVQEEAVAEISVHDEGILCAPTAFGKTAVAAWLIAKRKVNTLVLVHRQQLLDQWQERLGDVPEYARRLDRAYRRRKDAPDRAASMSRSFRACIRKKQ